jgi:hypothetical protein
MAALSNETPAAKICLDFQSIVTILGHTLDAHWFFATICWTIACTTRASLVVNKQEQEL